VCRRARAYGCRECPHSPSFSTRWSSHERESPAADPRPAGRVRDAAEEAEPPRLRPIGQVVSHLALHRRDHAHGRADLGVLRPRRGASLHRHPSDLLHPLPPHPPPLPLPPPPPHPPAPP